MWNRRRLIASLAAFPALGLGAAASAAPRQPQMQFAAMRGSIDALEFGVRPGAADDQSRAFERMLQSASRRDLAKIRGRAVP